MAKWRKSAIVLEFILMLNVINILPRTPKQSPQYSFDDRGAEVCKGLALNNTPIIEKDAINSAALETKSFIMKFS